MTSRRFATFWTVPICASLAGTWLAPHAALAADPPDLSGEWVIDLDASDEPADLFEPVTQRKSGRFGGIRAGVSIFGIPVGDTDDLRGDGDRQSDAEQDSARRELGKLHRHLTDALDSLSIVQSADSLRVRYDDLGTFIYATGGTTNVGDAIVHTGWRGDAYVIARESEVAPQVIERFRLDRRNPNRLDWTVEIELSSGKNVTIERVFDRADRP